MIMNGWIDGIQIVLVAGVVCLKYVYVTVLF